MIKMDPNADYYNDMQGLAKQLIEDINAFRIERQIYPSDVSFGYYMDGLIAAREVVLDRIGVPMELYVTDC